MAHSSFTTVTESTSSLADSPLQAREASANMIIASLRLEELELSRQQIKKQLETLSLLLNEAQNMSLSNSTPEKQQHYLNECREWQQQLAQLNTKVRRLDKDITYYTDYNEDLQKRFRISLAVVLKKIENIHEEKIKLILEDFKTTDLDLKNLLKKTLNNTDLQEAYLKHIGQPETRSFTDKLKSWFKKGESNARLT